MYVLGVILFAYVAQSHALTYVNEQGIPTFCDCHKTCRGPQLVYLCGTGPEDKWANPCKADEYASLPFCDSKLSIDERVADLIARVPIDEKIGKTGTSTPLSNYATGLPSAGVPYSQWWSEALHGIAVSPGVLFDRDTTPYATSFPQIVSTSHSFNRTLFAAVGAAISSEIRAFNNVGHAGLAYWTPNLNIFRDPRWGRGQETPGEDPFLTAAYVESYVPALQSDSADPAHLKVSACCKHYVAYSFENYNNTDRHHFDANVTSQDMADTYLPAFEACATPGRGGGSCLMCSYNEVNGVPSCANKKLLSLARDVWGFDGYVTSDCGAVEDVYDTHYYASTPAGAVRDTLQAGMDMECGKWFDLHLQRTFEAGLVDEATIDQALSHLLRVQMRLGRFDADGPFNSIAMDVVNSVEHQRVALEAAQQAVVMLKNEGSTLPLSAASLSSLAVIGPNADVTKTLLGNYAGIPAFIISPLEGISLTLGASRVHYALGCEIDSNDTSSFAAAASAVSASEAVVLVMGIDQSQEKEGRDRVSIALPGVQMDLIESVLVAAAGKPVVLVVLGGGAVCLNKYKSDPRVQSILFVGYPGQAGGQGLADVLFGSVSPSGRLTQTFYAQPFLEEVSFFDMHMRPSASNPGRGYRFYTGTSVVYPFGWGLSYTTFEYQWARGGEVVADKDKRTWSLSLEVANTGSVYTAAETVLVFLRPPAFAPAGSPIRSLRFFDKVSLAPGKSTTLSVPLSLADFSLASDDGVFEVVRGEWTVEVGGLTKTISI